MLYLRLVTKLSIIALGVVFGLTACASELAIDGSVMINGEHPVRGGSVVITDLRSRGPGQMPDSHILAIAVTDIDGRYYVKLKNVQGQLNIRLIRDLCSWHFDYAVVDEKTIKSSAVLTVNLEPDADICDCHSEVEKN